MEEQEIVNQGGDQDDLTPKRKRSKKSNIRSNFKINTDIMTVDDKKASFVI